MVPCLCNFLHQSIVIQGNSIWYSLAYLGTNVQKVHSRVLKWLTKTLYCNIYLGLYFPQLILTVYIVHPHSPP